MTRINSGMILMATGPGYGLLTFLATQATQSYKDVQYISAVVFFTQGLLAYLYPGQNEKDMEKIDQLVNTTN